ncbi:MAG TPA: DNA-binding domain-containing protein [Xanthomonadales bacterium]|nr:DNA-binding domain-containing protein [Xanthomonadales bacterium]
MNGLRGLQHDLQRYLLHPRDDARPQVTGRDPVDALARLNIYATAYRLRLVDALRANYPKLAAWLGENKFTEVALAYLQEQPSRYRSIRYFGDRLAEFLDRTERWRGRPALALMARFEWALDTAFDAADAAYATPAQMQELPPPCWAGARLTVHPSVRSVDLDWNIVRIWKALDQEQRPPRARRARRRAWLIWRQGLETHFRSLPPVETEALNALIQGRTFAELCELLCRHYPESSVPGQAAALLSRWLGNGVISEIHPGSW